MDRYRDWPGGGDFLRIYAHDIQFFRFAGGSKILLSAGCGIKYYNLATNIIPRNGGTVGSISPSAKLGTVRAGAGVPSFFLHHGPLS